MAPKRVQVLKGGKLIGHFVSNGESPYFGSPAFTAVLDFIKTAPKGYKMYEKKDSLRISVGVIHSVAEAMRALTPLAISRSKVAENSNNQ